MSGFVGELRKVLVRNSGVKWWEETEKGPGMGQWFFFLFVFVFWGEGS